MRVLVIYAHHHPESFTHAVLDEITRGLSDAGHDYEVVDLHAIGWDPVFRPRDGTQFIHETVPRELLEQVNLREEVLAAAGGPIRRFLARRWLRGKNLDDLIKAFQANRPSDVVEQQEKVAGAEALIFVTPVFWMGFPAILKGWFERVFAYGFAYTLTPEGWKGDLDGRVPLLTHRKGLIVSPTFFTEEEYGKGWRAAMDTVVCDWGLRMAGVQESEHVLFYAVIGVDDETRRGYLQQAYRLGLEFCPAR
jgi:NAD(P)H dehydrogenase (quinone)